MAERRVFRAQTREEVPTLALAEIDKGAVIEVVTVLISGVLVMTMHMLDWSWDFEMLPSGMEPSW